MLINIRIDQKGLSINMSLINLHLTMITTLKSFMTDCFFTPFSLPAQVAGFEPLILGK
jgi:hypothetical protein